MKRLTELYGRIRWEINWFLHPVTWRLRLLLHPEGRRRWKRAGELAARGYDTVIWHEPDQYSDGRGTWYASIDEYPEHFTNGDTVEKAKAMVADLLQNLIDFDLEHSNPIPEPNSMRRNGGWITMVMQGGYPARFAYLREDDAG